MAREFETPGGDNSQDRRKKGRQIPPDSLRNHEGDGGGSSRETHKKEVQQPYPRSSREAFEQSSRKAKAELAQRSSLNPVPIAEVAVLDSITGDTNSVRHWEERLAISKSTYPDNDPYFVHLYFKGILLGSIFAYEQLNNSLHSEYEKGEATQDAALNEGERYDYERTSYALQTLVQDCAEKSISADIWIERYAVDRNHQTTLKLKYYQQAQKNGTNESLTISERYQDEFTEHYLQGDMSWEIIWNLANDIYQAQEDPTKKQAIVGCFKDATTAPDFRLDKTAFDQFFSFSKTVLSGKDRVEFDDVMWFESYGDALVNAFLEAGYEQYDILTQKNELQLALAHYYTQLNKTPSREKAEKIIAIIDEQTAEILNLDIPDQTESFSTISRNRMQANKMRNARLKDAAYRAAAAGDFTASNQYLSAINDELLFLFATQKCLSFAKTQSEIELAKPDEMELLLHEDLSILFAAKQTFLSNDIEAIAEMTKSFVERGQYRGMSHPHLIYFIEELFKEGVRTLYEQDSDAGKALSADLVDEIIKETGSWKGPLPIISTIAEIQLSYGDPVGWQNLSSQVDRRTNPEDRVSGHTNIAFRAAQDMKEKGIPFAKE